MGSNVKKVSAIVQARMGSNRLPGKVLRLIDKKPLLGFLMERLHASQKLNGILLVTSNDSVDDLIAEYCQKNGIECFRGSLENVAERFAEAVKRYDLEAFVRVNADSPLLDHHLIDWAVDIFQKSDFDIVTNCLQRTFPKGQSVEVVSTKAFLRGYQAMNTQADYEHVTQYFYRNSKQFKIYNISSPVDCSNINLSVDTLEDFDMLKQIIISLRGSHLDYGWQNIVEKYNKMIKQTSVKT